MKISTLILALLVLVCSCEYNRFTKNIKNQNNETQEQIDSENNKSEQSFEENDTIIHYLSRKNIQEFIEETPTIKPINLNPKPFDKLYFNKVIAYDYDGQGERYMSIVNKSGQFVDVVTNQKALTREQVEHFVNFITDKNSYGQSTAACFDPGWALVFFKDNKIVFVVDICLDCNSIRSIEPIPATSAHNEVYEEYTIPREGFSTSARKSIQTLAKELGMKYGDYPSGHILDE